MGAARSTKTVIADDTLPTSLAMVRAALTRQREFSPALWAFLARQNSRVTRSLGLPAVSMAVSEADKVPLRVKHGSEERNHDKGKQFYHRL